MLLEKTIGIKSTPQKCDDLNIISVYLFIATVASADIVIVTSHKARHKTQTEPGEKSWNFWES